MSDEPPIILEGQVCELKASGGQVHVIQRDAVSDAILAPSSSRTPMRISIGLRGGWRAAIPRGLGGTPVIFDGQVRELHWVGGQVRVSAGCCPGSPSPPDPLGISTPTSGSAISVAIDAIRAALNVSDGVTICLASIGRARHRGRKTLADVHEFMRHLPEDRLQRQMWRHVALQLKQAAADGDTTKVAVSLRMVPSMEGVECRPQ
jgi:hypothetical protein